MIPYKGPARATVPQGLEKRLEIIRAIHALGVDTEFALYREAEIAAIRRDLNEITLAINDLLRTHDVRLRSCVIKYNPDQLRVPSGNPDGGQWRNEDGVGSADATSDIRSQFAAAGDFRCEGFSGGCQTGGSYGTSAMYNVFGRNLCMDCAVKLLGIQNDPSSVKVLKLSPHLIEK